MTQEEKEEHQQNGEDTREIHSSSQIDNETNSEFETHDIKASIAGVAGNILEWYDFATFGFFSDFISENFFPPDQDGNTALIQTFVVFGAAFLVRPIGGAIIGKFGDTHGRKGALETSILLMVFPTFLMGCLPTFSMIGWFSTVLLILMRLLQGLSVGGQVMSSVVFTLERSHQSRWGFWGSTVNAASCLGATLGSVFSAILRESLTDDQLRAWGWRIPFFFGVTGAFPAIYLKYYAKEEPIVSPMKSNSEMKVLNLTDRCTEGEENIERKNPLRETFRRSNMRSLIACALLPSVAASTYYLTFIWLGTYMEAIMDPPVPHAMAINSATGIFGGFFLTLLGGLVADKIGDYPKQLFVSGLLLCILSPFLFGSIGKSWGESDESIPLVCFLIQTVLAILLALWSGAMSPWILLKFPPELRLTSISLGYNIAVSIWGGFSPATATALQGKYGTAAPGYLISVAAIVSMQALWIAPEGYHEVSRNTLHGENDLKLSESEKNDEDSKPIWAAPDDYDRGKEIEMV